MDFQLSEDQIALRDGIRSFCDTRVANETFPELEKVGGFDKELWGELAEMGVFALRLSEDEGGVGLGWADAVVVFAELGRRVVPGPTIWSHLAAGLVEGAETGETVVGGLDLTHGGSGPLMVEHLESLDRLLVLRDSGVESIDARNVKGEAVATPLDPLTPVHHVADLPGGDALGDASLARALSRQGAALASGQMLGIAETTLELAVDYAKKREQFGRAIGSFQSLKHMMADMFTRQEAARAGVYAAGATLDDPEVGDLDRAVGAAKITAGDAAMKNSRACIQIHGGMGYTWEVPAHYFLKRTWVLETSFGTIDDHADRVAAAVEASLEG